MQKATQKLNSQSEGLQFYGGFGLRYYLTSFYHRAIIGQIEASWALMKAGIIN